HTPLQSLRAVDKSQPGVGGDRAFSLARPDLLSGGRAHKEGPASLQNLGQLSSAAQPTGAGVQTPALSQLSSLQSVTFVENGGQWDAAVKYVAQGGPVSARFADNSIQLNLGTNPQAWVGLTFEGASPTVTLTGDGRQSGYYNFFLGNDPSKWVSN